MALYRRAQRALSDPDPAWDSVSLQEIDAGPHRRGDDEGEEEQCNDEPKLPERQREDDNTAYDQRCDKRSTRGFSHPA